MAATPGSARKGNRSDVPPTPSSGDADVDLDLSSDIKGILEALQQARKRVKTDGHKKNEEIVNIVKTEVSSLVEDAKVKTEKERQTIIRAAAKQLKDCEACLKAEAAKYQAAYEKFRKDREHYQRAYEDAYAKFEEAKESLVARYEQQRKKEKATFADLQKACSEKIAGAEEQVKKMKENKSVGMMLRKTVDSFFQDDDD